MTATGRCLFVSDLHGRAGHVRALLLAIDANRPSAVFIGGDLSAATGRAEHRTAGAPPHRDDRDCLRSLASGLEQARHALHDAYPTVFVILGNDDPRIEEERARTLGVDGLWLYIHNRAIDWNGWRVYGYACVPPTPFQLKDWECYDVSRYVDPGCVSPEEGFRTIAVDPRETRHRTIAADLAALAGDSALDNTIWLFHAPPYQTALDRAALDGKSVDHVPLDPHVGSVAVRRFIERRQPAVTLHGHIHESARLTGRWSDRLGRTVMLSAAHDGPELAVVRFDPESPHLATRQLLDADLA